MPIGGMAYPDQTPHALDCYPALTLFAQSARRVQQDFELTGTDLSAVVRICHLVHGMPLAIMLAAAWMRILRTSEIAKEIERGLDFLSTEWREVELRHASMRAMFDHSWSLLSQQEQTVLARLSVFRGSCTRQAAQQVSGASLRDLMALVNHSLLQHQPIDRFEMHELLRQYAEEKLAQYADAGRMVRDQHSAHYAAISDRWKTDLIGGKQLAALAEMDLEIENVRAAWDWALRQGQIAQLGRMFAALWRYGDCRDRQHYATWFGETARALSTLTRQATTDPCVQLNESRESHLSKTLEPELRLLSKMLTAQAFCGDGPHLARKSLSILKRPEMQHLDIRAEKAFALLVLSLAERSDRAAEKSLALYRELGDPWGTAYMLCTLCYCIPNTPATDVRVQKLYQEALSISQTHGDRVNASHASNGLANHALYYGRLDKAEQLGQQALELRERIGDRRRLAWTYDLLSAVAMARGQFDKARKQIEQAEVFYEEVGNDWATAQTAFLLGTYEIHLGQFVAARRCGERVLELCPESEISQTCAHLLLSCVALAEGAYDRARMLLEGREPIANDIQSGRHQVDHLDAVLACALHRLGQRERAHRHLLEALRLVPDARVFWPLLYSLAVYALLLIDEGETEQGVELYALASRYPFVANSHWFDEVFGQQIVAASAKLPTRVVEAAQARGQAKDLGATMKELQAELE